MLFLCNKLIGQEIRPKTVRSLVDSYTPKIT
nr:MAG TPA: hypothetical protein [Caudoviricetes sp.]